MVQLSDTRRNVLAEMQRRGEISGLELIPMSLKTTGKYAGGIKWGSTILRKLARMGLAERVGVPIDGRTSYFTITEEGREWLMVNG